MVVEVDCHGEDPEGTGAEKAGLGWEAGGDEVDGPGEGHRVCWSRVRWFSVEGCCGKD